MYRTYWRSKIRMRKSFVWNMMILYVIDLCSQKIHGFRIRCQISKYYFGYRNLHYKARVDIWALKLVIFESATDYFPLDEKSSLKIFRTVAYKQDLCTVPSNLDSKLQSLLKGMLQIKYQNRITPENFLKHQFIIIFI